MTGSGGNPDRPRKMARKPLGVVREQGQTVTVLFESPLPMRWWRSLATVSDAVYRRSFWAIVVVAPLARAALILATPHFIPFGDPADYERNAASIATGHGMGVTLIASPGTPSALRPPAYQFLLGARAARTRSQGATTAAVQGRAAVALVAADPGHYGDRDQRRDPALSRARGPLHDPVRRRGDSGGGRPLGGRLALGVDRVLDLDPGRHACGHRNRSRSARDRGRRVGRRRRPGENLDDAEAEDTVVDPQRVR